MYMEASESKPKREETQMDNTRIVAQAEPAAPQPDAVATRDRAVSDRRGDGWRLTIDKVRRGRMAIRNASSSEVLHSGATMNYALWVVQGLLALLFLFAGGTKLVLPIEEMTKQMPLPGLFLRFIGVAEVLGGLGLILPGLTGIRPGLTPLAAVGLVIIMVGATVLSAATGGIVPALLPLVVGFLLAFVAYRRWRE
jgi:uncharacterized membrane protein YphA (DoxX/SURF4 family)